MSPLTNPGRFTRVQRAESDDGLGQACVVRDQAVTNSWVGIVAGHVRFMQQGRL